MISLRPPADCQSLVAAMVAAMQHEPSYLAGTYFVPEMGLYAGWIAHGNSFAARNPIWNEQRDLAVIISGECFLDAEAGIELRRKGHDLGPEKSTWLIHLYEEQGEQFFGSLNGLFSGLLIDKRKEKAFLFNDRYGIERVYIHETPDAVYFASEAKALLSILERLRSFDPEGVAQYLAVGCTLESRTLFRGVENMPGASLWTFQNAKCHKGKYFSPETWERQTVLSVPEFHSQFQQTFKRVIPRYIEFDSRLGISLTGGLDSRMIMACLPETREKSVCFTYSGERVDTLDARIARKIAAVCGLEHHSLHIGRDFFADFALFADSTVYITDGCFGILGAHEIYMSRLARQLSPVRLTGNYGGEVLRGVCNFKSEPLAYSLADAELHPAMRSSVEQVGEWKDHRTTFAAFREVPWHHFGNLQAGRSQIAFRTPYLDNDIVSLAYRTPESLRSSRTPASQLVKENNARLAAIPTDRADLGHSRGLNGYFRRCAAEITFKLDYVNNEGFPPWLSPLDPLVNGVASRLGLIGLHKHLHYRRWFKEALAPFVNGALDEACKLGSPLWNTAFLEKMAADCVRGRGNYVLEINAVLSLQSLERQLFRKLPSKLEPLTHR